MRVLLTGGCSFIGSAVCRHAVQNLGWSILNIDKLTYAADPRNVEMLQNSGRYQLRQADICDAADMQDAFSDFKPAAVIHLAAESHVDRSITGSTPFIHTNVLGTHTILEAARRYWETLDDEKAAFRFLQVSTEEAYGSLGPEGLFHEATPYDPRSPYSASKAASDHLAAAWHGTYGVPTLISNCSNNYGPYHFPEKLIPLIILNALDGNTLPVYGDGMNVRDWLHVEDHARAPTTVVQRGRVGEKYNISRRAERTNLDVVHAICDTLDELVPNKISRREQIRFVADRPGHDRRYAIDCTKIEGELDWTRRETFESGIRRTVQWSKRLRPSVADPRSEKEQI